MPKKRKRSTPSPKPAPAAKPQAKAKEKRKVGRPAGTGYHPTPAQRSLVEALAAYGIPEDEMVKLVENPETKDPISPVTLRKHFRRELDRGFVAANAKVATGLFKNATMATEKSPYGDKVAQFFWLKTRARWRERHEGAGDGTPPPVDQEHNRLEVARRVAFLLVSEARKAKPAPVPQQPQTGITAKKPSPITA